MGESGRRIKRSILSDIDEKMDLAVVSAVVAFFIILVSFVLTFPSLWVGFLLTILLTIAVFISVYIDESNVVLGFAVFMIMAILGWFLHWPVWITMTVASTILFVMSLLEQLVYTSRR